LFAVHTVWPVNGFEAQEFTTLGVEILVGMTLLPSTLATETPVAGVEDQLPLGTYAVTFVPVTRTVNDLV